MNALDTEFVPVTSPAVNASVYLAEGVTTKLSIQPIQLLVELGVEIGPSVACIKLTSTVELLTECASTPLT